MILNTFKASPRSSESIGLLMAQGALCSVRLRQIFWGAGSRHAVFLGFQYNTVLLVKFPMLQPKLCTARYPGVRLGVHAGQNPSGWSSSSYWSVFSSSTRGRPGLRCTKSLIGHNRSTTHFALLTGTNTCIIVPFISVVVSPDNPEQNIDGPDQYSTMEKDQINLLSKQQRQARIGGLFRYVSWSRVFRCGGCFDAIRHRQ
ncbi:uncharacterized protein F4807DRAFT_435812 [Annulohypoxylon truncatum]|uniref:uncharacterized protein n=1 Tax=Annulohypoxylon truncatum TaxID=327061 RepID=UPI002008BBCB|nr:uncharacterized protein F4807DRAFT_435812 [Annulohypoxylon truncatum]KAI1207141.1 hypothetical protein F4807DRAFT_435812 [Annulohypoxylon truncatum]